MGFFGRSSVKTVGWGVFYCEGGIFSENDKGSYRYSSVRATDDDEFEALLPNGDAGASDSAGFGGEAERKPLHEILSNLIM